MRIQNSINMALYTTRQISQRQQSMAEVTEARTPSYDVTDLTRNQMRSTTNDLIRSGNMSLEESSAVVPMAGPSAATSVSGTPDATYDAAPLDVLKTLQRAITGAQSRNDQKGAQAYADSLNALERYQTSGSQPLGALQGSASTKPAPGVSTTGVNPSDTSGSGKPDFTHMTPRQLYEQGHSLYASGKIDLDGLAKIELTTGIWGKDAPVSASESSQPVNYIKSFQDQLSMGAAYFDDYGRKVLNNLLAVMT